MISPAIARVATSAFVIALCAGTLAQAVALWPAARADARATMNTAAVSSSWSGLAMRDARELATREASRRILPAEPARRGEALQALLREAPLSGAAWIELAAARRDSGASLARSIAAFNMSAIVAPRELAVAVRRIEVGVPMWSDLPPPARAALVADIVEAWPATPPLAHVAIDGLVGAASERERLEIARALRNQGPRADAVLRELGLDALAADAAP